MKKNTYYLFILLSFTLTIFSACRKEVDFAKDEVAANTALAGQPTYCRIESIWQNPFASDQRFILILYDEFENPTAITTPLVTTGSPYRTFKYDQWHRLREYIGSYAGGNYQFWHFYGYDQNGRISVDTMLNLGISLDNYSFRVISHIEYDNQNRIIREHGSGPQGFSFDEHYAYDAAGNMVREGITYDNKLNVNRTNNIWMFLARDYSMNNPFVAEEYNSSGYPTRINRPTTTSLNFIRSEIFLNHSQIGYGCRPSYWVPEN